ncbi:MAG: chorismate-binding protein [Xanthomonadales bacterium]|nr:Aminodeoxychorismate synthase component 1 [Xanthomonadales bacterium]MCC6594147.1 chorismate-binding protein [Xanthomonadales bacterium]MCE7931354.1 aminodeoxychorismate synthase, component I [Xanthomonadales bacterium PRO6]
MPAFPSHANFAQLRRTLGDTAPALLLSAAAGPQGQLDLLPLVAGEPLHLPYPNHPQHATALAQFEQALRAIRVGSDEPQAGYRGGWLLYLAYDFGAVFEPRVPLLRPELDEPLALLWRVPALLRRERASARCELLGDGAADWHPRLLDALATNDPPPSSLPPIRLVEDDPQCFLDGVARIHDYLAAGDSFQVNLSRAWRAGASSPIAPDALFARLCAANPAPFAGLLCWHDFAVVSSSPERLVSVRGRRVETRPIAGTRRRDGDPVRDAELLTELRRDPKERAEHIMLLDLERNDLGRLCEPGSVHVDELGIVESYAHVHHLVSNVAGRLRDGIDAWQLLRALFPGGTITGCPKVRCMQIIAELEGTGRGAYTGALGWIGDDGALDLSILIRTMVARGERLLFRTGAGIVADSLAARELAETRNKALGLLRALGANG